MARKEKIITLKDRDQDLTFKIREMPTTKLEKWIIQALLLLAGSGMEVPDGSDLKNAGAYLAQNGLSALGKVDFEKAEPLLDELLFCCSRVVENVEERCTPQSMDNYVMDVKTLFTLRMESVKLNLGFLQPEGENLFDSHEKASTEMPLRAAGTQAMPTSPAL